MWIRDLCQLPKTLKQMNNELELLNIVLERMVNIPMNVAAAEVFQSLKETSEHLSDMKKILADLGGWDIIK